MCCGLFICKTYLINNTVVITISSVWLLVFFFLKLAEEEEELPGAQLYWDRKTCSSCMCWIHLIRLCLANEMILSQWSDNYINRDYMAAFADYTVWPCLRSWRSEAVIFWALTIYDNNYWQKQKRLGNIDLQTLDIKWENSPFLLNGTWACC